MGQTVMGSTGRQRILCSAVFTTSGSASPAATVVLKRLAARLAEARDLSYSTVMGWLRAGYVVG